MAIIGTRMKASEKKTIVITSRGMIGALNMTRGPILMPIEVECATVFDIAVKERHDVYECDPTDPTNAAKRIKIDFKNARTVNFGEPSEKKVELPKDSGEVTLNAAPPVDTKLKQKKEQEKIDAIQNSSANAGKDENVEQPKSETKASKEKDSKNKIGNDFKK